MDGDSYRNAMMVDENFQCPMHIQRNCSLPSTQGLAEYFTGPVRTDLLLAAPATRGSALTNGARSDQRSFSDVSCHGERNG